MNDTINIALFYKSLLVVGGAERLVIEEAKWLSKLSRKKVSILTFNVSKTTLEILAAEDISIVTLGGSYIQKIAQARSYLKKFNINHILSSSGHFDVFLISLSSRISYSLHLHHPLMMSPTDRYKYSYLYRSYYLKHIKQSQELEFMEKIRKNLTFIEILAINFKAILYNFILYNAQAVFVLSRYSLLEKKNMLRLKNAFFTAGAINLSDIRVKSNRVPLSKKKSINILCLGRLVWDKRFHLIINACNLLNKQLNVMINLHIVGDGPQMDYLYGLSQSNTTFYGSISDQELEKVWAITDIFCTPDWADFKITIFEALSKGVHTLVTYETDVSPAFKNSGLLSYANPTVVSIYSELESIIQSEINYDLKMLENALEKLTWKNYFSTIHKIISEHA